LIAPSEALAVVDDDEDFFVICCSAKVADALFNFPQIGIRFALNDVS
jgi:hypothetical protein